MSKTRFWGRFKIETHQVRFEFEKFHTIRFWKYGFLLKTTPKPSFGHFLNCLQIIQIISSCLRPTAFSDSHWASSIIRWKNEFKKSIFSGFWWNPKNAFPPSELTFLLFGARKWSIPKKTGNYPNFTKNWFLVDFDHFRPLFDLGVHRAN